MIEPRQDVSQSEIQDRREYWTSYAEEQGKLFERQYKLENDLRTARQNLAKIPGTQRNRIRPRFIDSGWKFIVAGRKACWYLAVQTFELAQIRNMPYLQIFHMTKFVVSAKNPCTTRKLINPMVFVEPSAAISTITIALFGGLTKRVS
ncbi:hypothetical protein EYC84_002120 [Monilinia fructicola]|uniref:Uncharacterized protein n=1 Tax=Monilinia fructicola TaxID=38448 RepID=A0A5M9JWP7_MONFR|nr:hypothetical protein EYC84_002120 [Monilinia fructicola]